MSENDVKLSTISMEMRLKMKDCLACYAKHIEFDMEHSIMNGLSHWSFENLIVETEHEFLSRVYGYVYSHKCELKLRSHVLFLLLFIYLVYLSDLWSQFMYRGLVNNMILMKKNSTFWKNYIILHTKNVFIHIFVLW